MTMPKIDPALIVKLREEAQYDIHYQTKQALLQAAELLESIAADGEVVVSRTMDGEIIAVTRQDEEGRILRVIAEAPPRGEKLTDAVIREKARLWIQEGHSDRRHWNTHVELVAQYGESSYIAGFKAAEDTYGLTLPSNEVWIVAKEHVTRDGIDKGKPMLTYLIPAWLMRTTFSSFDAAASFIKANNLPIGWVAIQLRVGAGELK